MQSPTSRHKNTLYLHAMCVLGTSSSGNKPQSASYSRILISAGSWATYSLHCRNSVQRPRKLENNASSVGDVSQRPRQSPGKVLGVKTSLPPCTIGVNSVNWSHDCRSPQSQQVLSQNAHGLVAINKQISRSIQSQLIMKLDNKLIQVPRKAPCLPVC